MLVVACDEQLPVREARAGEPDAWRTLFKRYQLPLYVYVCELVRDEQTSLDIVQETFVSAARNLGGLREDAKFGSWLFSIAHQKCIQQWRKQRPGECRSMRRAMIMWRRTPGPEELLIRKEQEEQFMKLMEQLATAHRAVLLLHFVEDFRSRKLRASRRRRRGR